MPKDSIHGKTNIQGVELELHCAELGQNTCFWNNWQRNCIKPTCCSQQMERQHCPSSFFSEVALVVAAVVVHAVFFQSLHQQEIVRNDGCLARGPE